METTAKKGLFRELLHRRVFQIVGLYFGAIFAVMEFTDLMVEQYSLSDVTITVVLAGMVSFLPAVIVLAWGFGAPGKDDWGTAEKITLPVNAIVTLALVGTLIYSQDVESVVDTVESNDEQGKVIVREIPKQKYINRLQIYFFDADESVGQQYQWLSYGLPLMLQTELAQNPFIVPLSLYNRTGNSILWRVQRAGFEDGLKVPLALAKSLSKDSNSDFFVMADLSQQGEQFSLNFEVYNTDSGKQVSSATIQANDPYQLVYDAAKFVKQQTNVQSAGEQLTTYLSAEERLSSNLESIAAFIEGINHWSFENEHALAEEDILQALTLDPSFAIAQINLVQLYADQGRFEEATKFIQQAMNYSYKLTESQTFHLRGINYALLGNKEEERRVYEVWNKLHPASVAAKNALANSYMWSGNEIEPALKVLSESLELDPNQDWIYARLGLLHEVLENYEQAKEYYSEYALRDVNSYIPHLALARIALKTGRLEDAKEYILTAMYQRSDMVTPVVRMADLALREGKIEEAIGRQNEAKVIAKVPNQLSNLLIHQINFFNQTGQISQAFDTLVQLQETMSEHANPVDTLIVTKLSQMHLYTVAGKQELAKEELAQLVNSVQPPFDKIISVGYLFHYLSVGDATNAKPHFTIIDELMRSQRLEHLFHILHFGKGLIAYVEQDYKAAAVHLKEAKMSFDRSVNSVNEDHIIDSIMYHLVRSLRLSDQLDEARETALNTLKEWPYHSLINLELAFIEAASGNNNEAKQAIEKALSVWQDADDEYYPKQQALELQQTL